VTLSPEERKIYDEILRSSLEEIDNAISSRSSGKAYSSILRAILRTRMLCDHGTNLETASTSRLTTPAMENEDTLASLLEGDEGIIKSSVVRRIPADITPLESSTVSQVEEDHECTGMVLGHEQHTSRDILLPAAASTKSGHSTKLFMLIQNLKKEDPTAKR
jgi:hypothetical protein